MSNDDSGFNPDKITFGIEVEVVAAGFAKGSLPRDVDGDEKILFDVAQRLIDNGIEVELITYPDSEERPSYTKWIVTLDSSIGYDYEMIVGLFSQLPSSRLEKLIHGGVEIVSPKFHLFPRRNWKEQISMLFKILKDNYRVEFDLSTGLHVHVGCGDSKFQLPTLLNIAAVLVIFQRVIEIWVHPGHRGVTATNKYIKSNTSYELLGGLTKLQAVERISGCKPVAELQRVMNHDPSVPQGRSKYFKYNFMSLTDIGTIEFRQHAGTKNVEEIHMWVLFCTALVRAAAALDGEMIQKMASRQKPTLEDLSQLVGEQFVSYYRSRFLYELL
ncbi:hypothetical protein RUND412_007053 [Rhizina undulata]